MSAVEPTKEDTIEELTKRAEAIKQMNVNAAAQAIQEVCEKFGVVMGVRTVIEDGKMDSAIVIKAKT